MRLLILYYYDNTTKNPNGKFANMIVDAGNEKELKKMFRILAKPKARFGIDNNWKSADFAHAYEQGGTEALSRVMQYGDVEFARSGEWLF